MKLKHFAGYGTVNAYKINKKVTNNGSVALTIKVIGDHERGLYCWDIYTLKHWLIDRFDHKAKELNPYNMRFDHSFSYELINNEYVDTITYLFMYNYNDDTLPF